MQHHQQQEQQDERFAADAFSMLASDAPALNADAIWARLAEGMAPAPAALEARPRPWWRTLADLVPSMSGPSVGRRAGFALAAVAALSIAMVVSLGSGGDRASAALLRSARSLSAQTDAAFADGTLSSSELDTLRGDAERLLQSILGDPAGLRGLSADDLGALTQVLTALEDRLRAGSAVAAPALPPVQMAAGIASDALRSAAPSHPALLVTRDRDERISPATPGVRTVAAGDGGSADIDVQAGTLVVVRTTPAAGWVTEVERATGREVEIDFRRTADGRRLQLNVELEDGQVRVRIDESRALVGAAPTSTSTATSTATATATATATSTAGGRLEERERSEQRLTPVVGSTNTYAAGAAGSVTVRHDGTSLVLVSANPIGGWSFAIEQQSGRELEVDFRSPGGRVKFNAELEDGQVRVRVDSEVIQSDSSGSGSGSSGSGSSGSGSSGSGSSGSGSSGGDGDDDGEGHD